MLKKLVAGLVLGFLLMGVVLEHGPINRPTLLGAIALGFVIVFGSGRVIDGDRLKGWAIFAGCMTMSFIVADSGCQMFSDQGGVLNGLLCIWASIGGTIGGLLGSLIGV